MSWTKRTVKEVADFHNNRRVPLSSIEREKRQGQYRYFGAQGVIDHLDEYIFDGEFVLIAEDGANLVTRNQPISQIVTGQFWVNNHAHIVTAKEGETTNYFLNTVLNSMNLTGYVTGAAQPKLSKKNLEIVELSLPDLPTQKRIAGVLSAYDDLIENNRRRIALLEEAARLIYREWFVHFRFPNHENTKFENGLPVGWELTELGSCTDLTWGDTKTTKSSYVQHGFDAYSAAGLDGKLEKFDFDRDGIVLSAIGANCGKTWLAKGKWSCIKNTIRIFPEHPNLSTEYLYFATLGEAAWVKRGAAQPFISQGDARSRKIIVPTHSVTKEFEKHAFPLLKQSNELRIQNQALTKARDLLLPRLMDGRIAV